MKTFNRDATVLLDILNSIYGELAESGSGEAFKQILNQYRTILFYYVHRVGYHDWLMRFNPDDLLDREFNRWRPRTADWDWGEHNIFDKARENKDLYGDKDKEHNKGFMYSYIYKASPLRAFYSY